MRLTKKDKSLINGQKRKYSPIFLPHFSIPGVIKLTLMFFYGINLAICLFFCSSSIIHKPNQHVKKKGLSVNKNLCFVTLGNLKDF